MNMIPDDQLIIYNYIVTNINIYYNQNDNYYHIFFNTNQREFTLDYISKLVIESGNIIDVITNIIQ
jgi:arginine deiminase